MTVSLEGTNSEGDLGFGVAATYQHRNLARGSETLTAKAGVNYESISGDMSGLINNKYAEYNGEVGIAFPKFIFPFLKKSFRQKSAPTPSSPHRSPIKSVRNTPA